MSLTPYVPGSTEGLPLAAQERLGEMRANDGQHALFTADLSVNEFLLIRDAGFEPLGIVMGCSIYHTGFQWPGLWENKELTVLTQAMYHARDLAMTRMQEEADLLGADGIAGVRLEVNRNAIGANVAEFLAVGTAIKHRDGGNYRTLSGRPFTSDLSGQDFWTLQNSGYRPVSLVMGNCVYRVAWQSITRQISQVGRNVELPNFTQALYSARELALTRMQAEAEAEGASGIVAADVHEYSYGWGRHVVEYFALGTSITPISDSHVLPTPQMVLSLNDPPRKISESRFIQSEEK